METLLICRLGYTAFLLLLIYNYVLFSNLKQTIIMTNEELAQKLTDLNTQVVKVQSEIQALKDLVADTDNVPQSVIDAVNTLGSSIQAADDMDTDAAL